MIRRRCRGGLRLVIIPALHYPDFAVRGFVHQGEHRAPEDPQQDSWMCVVVIRQHCPGVYADHNSAGAGPEQHLHRLAYPPNAGSAEPPFMARPRTFSSAMTSRGRTNTSLAFQAATKRAISLPNSMPETKRRAGTTSIP